MLPLGYTLISHIIQTKLRIYYHKQTLNNLCINTTRCKMYDFNMKTQWILSKHLLDKEQHMPRKTRKKSSIKCPNTWDYSAFCHISQMPQRAHKHFLYSFSHKTLTSRWTLWFFSWTIPIKRPLNADFPSAVCVPPCPCWIISRRWTRQIVLTY